MRPVREITADEERFRTEPMFKNPPRLGVAGIQVTERGFVKPEPEGTIVLFGFRVTGYGQDCDGSALAEIDQINKFGSETGWTENAVGLYPDAGVVVSQSEFRELFERRREVVEFVPDEQGGHIQFNGKVWRPEVAT